jgi:small subunit ribosomal protein S2
LAVVTIKSLLEAGVHFGHQTRRWNPKMKRFIFEERNGIYIIDLQQTLIQLNEACEFLRDVVRSGKSVLFVGTKRQARQSIEEAAQHCSMPHVTQRWLGGTLTNNQTIRRSISRLKELEAMVEDGRIAALSKKEAASLNRERQRLHRNLDGIQDMNELPGAVFIVDTKRERIATHEAGKLGIPIIAMIDTNADPDEVDFPIPGNDDAVKSVSLISSIMAAIVAETRAQAEKLGILPKEPKPKAREAKKPAAKPKARVKRRVVKKVVKRRAPAKKAAADKPEEKPAEEAPQPAPAKQTEKPAEPTTSEERQADDN